MNIPGVPSTTGLPFASSGAASWAVTGSKLTVNQTSPTAVLNWQSFNISADGIVQFVQPSSSSVALNEIYDSNPTQIFGALDANGKIFLINQNGIIFGAGAQVNVGGLVASSLGINPDVAQNGLTDPSNSSQAAFSTTYQTLPGANGPVTVQQGATLQAADGGQIFLFAPTNVTNLGTIHTPDGQTVLAAGSSVYLAASSTADPDLRGVVVEVSGSGMVQNGLASNSNASSPQQLVGQIIAEHGNISIAALAVNQYGRLNATTSVNENGSIYLQARNGTVSSSGNVPYDTPGGGGTLTLGQNSDTEVSLDTSDPTETVDSVAQPPSTIMMSGYKIDMLQGSVARATAGVIDVYADSNFHSAITLGTGSTGLDDQLGTAGWNQGLSLGATAHSSDGSRFYMAAGSVLDVSGASITLPVSDNVIPAKLEGTELADSPLLRNGPLHGQTINFDIRAHGTNADGTTWWGTSIANITGEILGITRNVVERNLTGGTVNVESQGDVILAPTSEINVSGGYIQYTGSYIDTSELLTLWGQTVPVGSASPYIPYAGVVNSTTTTDTKWGVTSSYQTTPSYYSPGYVEGKDAGTLSLTATSFILDGTVSASTVVGPYQTQPTTVEPPLTQPDSLSTAAWLAEWAASPWVHATAAPSPAGGTPVPVPASLYRPYDEVPKGATLQIGTPGTAAITGVPADLVVNNNVTIAAGEVLDGLRNADGSGFDPLTDPLPADFTTSILQPALLDAFQNVSIYTNGNLIEPAGVALTLASGGSFKADAASIDIEGGIDVPSGSISLAAAPTYTDFQSNPDTVLTLGAAGSLTARGEWVNDSNVLYPDGNPAPLYIGGGTVSLLATASVRGGQGPIEPAADLILKPGSVIDVSGGARLSSSGSLNAGKGGKIAIDASTVQPNGIQLNGAPPAPQLELGATLRAYGVYEGGSLSIAAAGVCIAASDCSGGNPGVVWITPEFFDSGGFSNYNVTADQNGLNIASGIDLQLVQQNFLLPSGYRTMPDAATLVGLATPTVLPLQTRNPVDLSLALYYPANLSLATSSAGVDDTLSPTSPLPSLVLPQGDVISTDPGGSLSLSSNTLLDIEGTLRAPGGGISLTLSLNAPGSSSISQIYYQPTQAIWLGSDAVLDASGAAEIFPNSIGKPTGSVLAGGTVSLTADPGYIELLPGSVIDVSGSSGIIDVSPVGGGVNLAQRIASGGGTIDLSSADGAVIGGTLLAAAGTAGPGANQPAGGSLYLAEYPPDPINTNFNTVIGPSTSDIRVSPTLAPTVVAPGSPVPDALEGLTLLPANTLAQGGFSIVALTTDGAGEIEFSGGPSLTASREVSLDSPTYAVDAGSTASIQAPYVEFGNSSLIPPLASGTTPGTGVLDVSGGFIELYGVSLLDGVGTANFDSSGDLRLRGLQLTTGNANTVDGALYGDGTINLTAQQIYPTTLTQFVISADPSFDPSTISASSQPTSGSIVVNGSEGTNTDVLSAGGSLTLVAASITQDGVLRAPLGTIALDATSLTLGPGSVTSTSADGLTIPFGTTQGNTQGGAQNTYDWIYALAGFTYIYGTDGMPPPSQHIDLNAANVNMQNGATVDMSGGGDLQAYEWIQGTGGTQDPLDDCNNCYAVMPGLHTDVAPYDPAIALTTGATLQVGEAVYLAAGSGVPAGTYVLLPARYALLPGAYLVTPMGGTAYQDMQPGQTFKAPDGGTIVSGYLTGVGLPFGSSRLNGFDVTPASVFLNEAQYNLTTGNQFFSAQEQIQAAASNAANEAVSAMRLPEDAGVLDINAFNFLALDGTLRATAQSDARGGEVDISNQNIVVAANPEDASQAAQSGALVLTTSSLDQLGAQTLLLGGTDSNGTVNTVAQTVTILSGASLSAPQILLTAQQQVSVQDGASLTASGTAPSSGISYSLSNAGTFLGVSAGPQIAVSPTGAADAGQLDLAAGSTLNAGSGSAYLYATAGISTNGSMDLAGGSLAVQAPDIALGNATNTSGAAVLAAGVLGSGDLDNLLLVSPSAITIAAAAQASAQNITIDAPGVASQLSSGQSASLSAADTLSLRNSQGTSITSTGLQGGSLTLSASNITLGTSSQSSPSNATGSPPTFAVNGFSSVALNAQNTLTAESDIDFSTDSGVAITTSRVTTATGVSASVTAAGALTMLSPSTASSLPAATSLGGQLDLTASSIEVGTELALPSGEITLATSGSGGNIQLDSGGSIDVAGVVQQYDTETVATPGGTVSLSALSGSIALENGSSVDVSAGTGGMAGSLSMSAPTGTVTVQGALAGNGAGQSGSFSVDTQSFGGGGFGALSAVVYAGGFTNLQSYRLRGSNTVPGTDNPANDITLTNTVKADDVLLEADNGTVTVDAEGKIDASGSSGGTVTLAAANGITLDGQINASATTAGGNGGIVELDVENVGAPVTLTSNSLINVSGGGVSESAAVPGATVVLPGVGGTVLLRVPYLTVENVANGLGGITLAGNITGASSTALEAYHAYQTQGDVDISSADTTASSSTYYADAQSFMTAYAAGATDEINPAAGWNFAVEPGVEIDATGNIMLDSPWNLGGSSPWRFGPNSVPGFLTLRAGGNVTFNDPLSDGFANASGNKLLNPAVSSWSYRIVAGSDLTAASPLAVGSNPADVTVAGGTSGTTAVRTGTGFIDVAASGDFVLSTPDSVLYTAGEAGAYDSTETVAPQPNINAPKISYAVGGGNISIAVAHNVEAAGSTNQFVNNWLYRQGGQPGAETAWGVQFAQFDQGVAALGGGNVTIRAGQDVLNLFASIASIGVSNGGSVEVEDGGNLTVAAGGSILGGGYYVGLGSATLSAGNSVGLGTEPNPVSPLIALGDASINVMARGDVQVSGIVNPTLLNSAFLDGPAGAGSGGQSYFSTYGSASSATLVSVSGNINLDDEYTTINGEYGGGLGGNLSTSSKLNSGGNVNIGNAPGALGVVSPSLTLASLSSDVNVDRAVMLFPSSQGNLEVLAAKNITVGTSEGAGELVVPDVDPSAMPSIATPQTNLLILDEAYPISSTAVSTQEHGPSPVFESVSEFDENPVKLVTLNGDIDTTYGAIWSAKPVIVSAGQDIVNLTLTAQNISPGDVTSITAGGDILDPQLRTPQGAIVANDSSIVVAGPGELQVAAGGNVDLGTSGGITTIGNQQNAALSSQGASVSVEAGTGGSAATAAQYSAFTQQYIDGSSQFDGQLVTYVEQVTGQDGLTGAEAKLEFNGMAPEQQRNFIEQLFFDLLKTYGEEAANTGNNADFAGAYAAIQTLFPGANPDLAKGQTDPYSGNISLYFSQIYTLAGGSISLLAPGGGVNAGLALAPTSYGVAKSPNQLGVVAEGPGDVNSFSYGDFQVNQSRVFSADGGNILVWSTEGNIDAGRGSKTSLSAAAPNISYDFNGFPTLTYYAPTAGSGIQALADTPGKTFGAVDLFAPHGVVNANDAGIVAGNLTVAATAVLGANNITVTGTEVGVPVAVTGTGASVVGASSSAGGALSSAQANLTQQSGSQQEAPKAAAELRWLDVFVVGFGEQTCAASDVECLKRQKNTVH